MNGQGTKKTIHIGINVNRLAEELKKKSKFKEVRISFLEFCAPLFNEVLEKACKENYDRIFVVSTMFTPGGVHSKKDIPEVTEEMKKKYNKNIIYVWSLKLKILQNLF